MSWFYWSLIQIPLISIGWLSLRKAQMKGLSKELSLLVFFIFILLSLFFWHIFSSIPFVLPPIVWIVALLFSGLLAVLSNLTLLSSFEKSENPGFSLALFSSKIILITLGSVLIFEDSLSFISLGGLFLVVLGIFLMNKNKDQTNFKWGLLALLAAVFDASYWLSIKYINQNVTNLYLSVILVLVILPQLVVLFSFVIKRGEILLKRLELKKSLLVLAFGGVASAIGNIIGIYAVLTAPNPGYALAVSSSYVILVAVISKLWLKSSLRPAFALATVIIVIGVMIIRLGS